MSMKHLTQIAAMSSLALLTACGGGGSSSSVSTSGGSTSPGSTGSGTATVPAGTTMQTSNYADASAKAAVFAAINGYRAQCGFPAFKQNTILDQAAQSHSDYMIANGNVVTDSEVQGKTGFTGVTGQDRANALGWPSTIPVGAADTGATYANATLTQTQYGQSMVDAWSSGIYHQVVIASTANLLGVGVSQTSFNGFPELLGGVELGYDGATPSVTTTNGPLTFPCQGVTGVPYMGVNEAPAAPGTSGSWGTPVTVTGNVNDKVSLTSATMTPAGGATITLNILNSTDDSNKLIGPYEAVAFPSAALQPATTYTVNLTGTYNGAPFSRTFTFTTGSTVG